MVNAIKEQLGGRKETRWTTVWKETRKERQETNGRKGAAECAYKEKTKQNKRKKLVYYLWFIYRRQYFQALMSNDRTICKWRMAKDTKRSDHELNNVLFNQMFGGAVKTTTNISQDGRCAGQDWSGQLTEANRWHYGLSQRFPVYTSWNSGVPRNTNRSSVKKSRKQKNYNNKLLLKLNLVYLIIV